MHSWPVVREFARMRAEYDAMLKRSINGDTDAARLLPLVRHEYILALRAYCNERNTDHEQWMGQCG